MTMLVLEEKYRNFDSIDTLADHIVFISKNDYAKYLYSIPQWLRFNLTKVIDLGILEHIFHRGGITPDQIPFGQVNE